MVFGRSAAPPPAHHLRRLADLVSEDAGDLLGLLRLEGVLAQQVLLQLVEGEAEHLAPPPLLLCYLLHRCGVVTDELLVLPAVLDDHASDGAVQCRVRSRLDLQVQTATLFREGGGERLARVHVDDRSAARHHPGREPHRLRLVRVGPGDEQYIRLLVVLEGGAEGVDAGVREAWHVVAFGGSVVGRVVGGADGAVGQLGDSVDVLVELVGVAFHPPGELAVLGDDVSRDLRHDVRGRVPGDRLEGTADPEERELKPVGGGLLGVVQLLGDGAASDAVGTAHVHHLGVAVGDDDHVMGSAVHLHDVVHVGRRPLTAKRHRREVNAKGVLIRLRPTLRTQRPGVYLVAAGYRTVLAGGGLDGRIRRRQRHAVARGVDGGWQLGECEGVVLAAHDSASTGSASSRLSRNPNIRPIVPVAYTSSSSMASVIWGRFCVA